MFGKEIRISFSFFSLLFDDTKDDGLMKPIFLFLFILLFTILISGFSPSSIEAALPEEMIYYYLGHLPQLPDSLTTPLSHHWRPLQTDTFIEGSKDYQYIWIMFTIPPLTTDRPAIYLKTITPRLISAQEYYYNGELIGKNGDSFGFGLATKAFQFLLLEPEASYPVFMVRIFNDYNPLFFPDNFIHSIGCYTTVIRQIFFVDSSLFLLSFFSLFTGLFSLLLYFFNLKDRLYLFMGFFLIISFFYLIPFNGLFSLLFGNYLFFLPIISYLTLYYLNAFLVYFLGEVVERRRETLYRMGHSFLFLGLLSLIFFLVNPYSQLSMGILYTISTGLALVIGLLYCIRYISIGEREEKMELRIMASCFILLLIGSLGPRGLALISEHSVSLFTEKYVGFGILVVSLSMVLVATRRIATIYRERRDLLEKYGSLVQTMMDGLIIIKRGVLIFVNRTFCQILGSSERELKGRPMVDLVAFTYKDLFNEVLNRIQEGEEVREYEMELLSKEGGTVDVLLTLVQTNRGENTIQGTVRDISRLKEAEDLSIKDELTGLYNRRYFNSILYKEIERAHGNRDNLSLLFIDLDFFKDYNDTYGHQMGDDTLKRVGEEILKKTKSVSDYFFRIGGEEFALLISGDEPERGGLFAEVLRDSIESLKIPHSKSRISPYLTISIGVVTMREEDLTGKEFFRLGDRALYEAKNRGRNMVVVYER